MTNNIKPYFMPIILIILIIVGGIYYFYQKKNQPEAAIKSEGGQAAVMGEKEDKQVISSSNIYINKVLEIRRPLNEKIEELLPKTKYKTLFEKEELIKEAKECKTMVAEGKKTLEELDLSTELQAINKKEIQSLEFLDEAMNAYLTFQNSDNPQEKQKQLELVNYKIDQSNKVIQDIKIIPSDSSGNSKNVIDILQ